MECDGRTIYVNIHIFRAMLTRLCGARSGSPQSLLFMYFWPTIPTFCLICFESLVVLMVVQNECRHHLSSIMSLSCSVLWGVAYGGLKFTSLYLRMYSYEVLATNKEHCEEKQ